MKRILSLDGGGIRGIFSLQILAKLEAMFRVEHRRHDLVLADVFDMFAGTSTGAIIATCLSWGMPVHAIESLYLTCGHQIFAKEPWYNRWKRKYRGEPIAELFKQTLSEDDVRTQPALLGSKRLRTLLLVVMRNATTGSPWPVSNIPTALYNDPARADCNLKIPLWKLLRGSTAAPSFFPPEEIAFGDQSFLFVDGGMSPFNNPTLMAVFMATLPAYGVRWPTGRDRMHVLSIGTADMRARMHTKAAGDVHILDALKFLAPALIGANAVQQDYVCRVLGDCVHGAPIDSEVGALDAPSLLSADEQKFTYVRYDQPFSAGLPEALRLQHAEAVLDDLSLIPLLQQMGQAYADAHVRLEHLFPRSRAGTQP